MLSVVAGLLNGEESLKEERVAFLYPASFDYATLIIAVVAAGGIAVPLSVHASAGELSHCLSVAGVRRLLLPSEMRSEALDDVCHELGVEQLAVEDSRGGGAECFAAGGRAGCAHCFHQRYHR